MKKKGFWIMKVLLILFLIVCYSYPLYASTSVNGIYYNFDATSKTATVTYGYNNYFSYVGNVNIPEEVEFSGELYTVTKIGSKAFQNASMMTGITIPNSIIEIDDHAFQFCEGLKEVIIPNSVINIGYYAFSYCSALTQLTIGNSVKKIDFQAFSSCESLTDLIIPNSVVEIGYNAFSGCKSLTSLIIGNNVTEIGYEAFSFCSALTEVVIPNSVTKINSYTFDRCDGLTKLIIGDGVTEIGSYAFRSCSALTQLTIGNRVTNIGYRAFSGCDALSDVVIPNSVENIAYGAFEYCDGLTSLTIGDNVKEIYMSFVGCKNIRQIKSYIYDLNPIVINSFDGDVYKNAILYVPSESVELYETTEGWKNFKNIVPIVGNTLTMTVTDDQNNDVTEEVNIVWYDKDERQIGIGNRLSGIENGTEVYYSVLLDEELGRVYREVKMQKVTAEEDTVTCKLKKIDHITLQGRVSATDIERMAATVSVKQMLNGKYEETFTAQTNEKGEFSITVFDDETDITVSREDCFDATLHRDRFYGNGNVGVIPLSLITGHVVSANITYYPAVAVDETVQETIWNDGLNNIEFTLTDKTKGNDITDFTVQNGNLIIKSGVEVGDEISLSAKSKQVVFADAATTFTITDGNNAFDLQLTELGGLDATCEVSNNGGTVGYLYDSNDVLVGKGSYVGETLTMRHLPNGVYTLVSMGRSLLLGNMTHLTDLAAVGLSAGKDYVATRVEMSDGYLTSVSVNEVPRLEETRFYYTTGNTYFNANKSSVTAGSFLTLSAHADFKAEYIDKVNGVTLTIDLPEGCQMVENSVIVNRETVAHTVNGNRVAMSLTKEQWQSEVRFCIIPTLNQSYTITAIASFDIDGQVQQPIGTAQFEAKGLSLNVPKKVYDTNITISGTAMGHSEVSIYDNDVFIGKTTSKADGSWTARCELYKPYSHSYHDIYAKIITENGLELTSETQVVEYDKYNLMPEKVTMSFYNGWYKTNIDVEFNLLEGVTAPSSYPFFTATDFTFLADFTRNDTTQIKNVNIKVLNSDGTIRTLPTMFDGKQNKWVASTKYSSASRLPKNVTVEYDFIPTEDAPFDSTRIIDDNNQFINLIKSYVTNIDTTKFKVLDANESMMVCQYQTYTMDAPVFIRMEMLDYDEWINELESKDYFTVEYDGVTKNVVDSVLEGRNMEWIWSNENKTMVYVETSISNETTSKSPNISRIQMKKAPAWLEATGRYLGNSILRLFNIDRIGGIINDYNAGYNELQNWLTKYNQTPSDHMKLYDKTLQLIESKCPDGTTRLSSTAYNNAKKYLQEYFNDANSMRQQFQSNLNRVDRDLVRRRNFSSQLSACIGIVRVAQRVSLTVGEMIVDAMNPLPNWENLADAYGDFVIRNEFYGVDQLSDWYFPASMDIINKYTNLQTSIKDSYKNCEQEDEDEEDDEEYEEEKYDEPIDEKSENKPNFPTTGTTPIIDPSGYVYEAVMSNRLEGVTVTCYQQTQGGNTDDNATANGVIWNAEDYSQQNPLKTDETGFYRWDVPQGMWQVKYEKEGYETTYSDWLPVPPPQLDVNIGMKQSTPPTVTKMRGFESGITIEMAKYMRPETMTVQNISVTRNGTAEKGSIEMLNEEKAPLGDESYVSKVKFVPETAFNTTDNVVVTVRQDVESYCGIKMEKDHVETVKIESEITDIVADSAMTVPYQGMKELYVQVLPKDAAAGKTLHAVSSSPIIAAVNDADVTIDENGVATFIVNGELPGGAVLSFTMDETDVTATSKIRVAVVGNTVSTPQASVRSGETIKNDVLITLSCKTEGAIIYYTLDGFCPCDEENRTEYVGPITLPVGQVTLKAMAVCEGMEDSDIAVYEYTVETASGIYAVQESHSISAYYEDGCIIISGAKGAGCRIYDLQGRELASRNRLDNTSRINVPLTDVYVISVLFGDGQVVTNKILAK